MRPQLQPPGLRAIRTAAKDPTRYLHAVMPLCATLGFVAEQVTPDSVVLSVPWSKELCTANGVIHGGVVMSLADAAGALLAYLNLPEGASGTTTIESKTNFLGAARETRLVAESRVLHAGGTTIVVETDLTSRDGPVARTTQTQLVLRPR